MLPERLERRARAASSRARPRAIVISSSRKPVDGAQRAKSSAAACTRWPSEPSIASASELSSHGAVVAPAVDEERRREQHAAARARSRTSACDRARALRCASSLASSRGERRARAATASQVVLGRASPSASSARRARPRTRPWSSARTRRARRRGGAMLAAGDRPMPEDVAQRSPKRSRSLAMISLRGAAVRAGEAAVLDQRDSLPSAPRTWSCAGSTGRSSRLVSAACVIAPAREVRNGNRLAFGTQCKEVPHALPDRHLPAHGGRRRPAVPPPAARRGAGLPRRGRAHRPMGPRASSGALEATLHFAELGVVLLLFLVGLELEPSRLWALRQPVFGLGGAQVVVTGSCSLAPRRTRSASRGRRRWWSASGSRCRPRRSCSRGSASAGS